MSLNANWYGPWCIYHAQVIRDKSVIVGDVFQYRRHVYENGEFRTQKINIEDWWELGFRYKHLPLAEICEDSDKEEK